MLYFTVPDFNSSDCTLLSPACLYFQSTTFFFLSFLSIVTDKATNKGNWKCKRQEAQTRLLGRVDCRRTQTTINLAPTNPALLVYCPKS